MIEGQNLNFAISGEKVAGLKPGKGKALGEWAMERREEWRSSAEGLFSLGLYFVFAEEGT